MWRFTGAMRIEQVKVCQKCQTLYQELLIFGNFSNE